MRESRITNGAHYDTETPRCGDSSQISGHQASRLVVCDLVGGCATGLLLTDPAASPVRATIDVDVLVEVATLVEYHRLSEQLRQLGFVEDTMAKPRETFNL